MENNNNVCCPKFDPALWDGKESSWQEKTFIKGTVRQIFHMPLPGQFAKAVSRMYGKAQEAGALPDEKDTLLLSYDPSPWKSELYLAVTKEVPDAENIRLSGTFMSKVFEGPYSSVPKWMKEMDSVVKGKGKEAKKYYFYFTTCPACAKKYGHNYVVAFAQVG